LLSKENIFLALFYAADEEIALLDGIAVFYFYFLAVVRFTGESSML
jgi:hypothetical protein